VEKERERYMDGERGRERERERETDGVCVRERERECATRDPGYGCKDRFCDERVYLTKSVYRIVVQK
jgi:hypothetical protein